MSTDISGDVADRQRSRAARSATPPGAPGAAAPPRQRRPALAALALLLIVGGALIAGLLAIRMDSRVPVLVAARDIQAGAEITADDLTTAQVASEDLDLLGEEYADQVVGAYAETSIPANTLLDERMVTTEDPIDESRAVVSVPLEPKLTPADQIRVGDLVQVVRASGSQGSGNGEAEVITTAYVRSVATPDSDDLGGTQVSSASLIVPEDAVAAVIDAAAADEAGLAILASGQDPDVELESN